MRRAYLLFRFAIAAPISLTTVSTMRAEEPVSIVIDSWWNEDYAKQYCNDAKKWLENSRPLIALAGCAAVTACTDMMPIAQSCQLNDPVVAVRDFEDRLVTQLLVDPECKSVHLARFGGLGKSSAAAADILKRDDHWTFFLDYKPGAATQAWTLIRNKPDLVTKGEGDPKVVAKSICAIATRQGAKLD